MNRQESIKDYYNFSNTLYRLKLEQINCPIGILFRGIRQVDGSAVKIFRQKDIESKSLPGDVIHQMILLLETKFLITQEMGKITENYIKSRVI